MGLTQTNFFSADTNTCLPGEFQCSSGHCLTAASVCDRRTDCPNAEDEFNCTRTSAECPAGFFLCSEGRCLPQGLMCDKVAQCFGGEDESGCECAGDQFQCKLGGGCLMKSKVCDGVADCADQSDEGGCIELNKDNGILGIG